MFVTMMLITTLCGTVTVTDSAPIPTTVQVDMGPNVDAMLRDLAEQIGVGAEAIYPLYLRQAQIQATVYTITVCAFLLLILAGIPFFTRGIRIDEHENKSYLSDDCRWMTSIGGAMILVGAAAVVIAVCVSAGDWITAIANPELWAIQHIASDAAAFVQ